MKTRRRPMVFFDILELAVRVTRMMVEVKATTKKREGQK
jgi:hypothetical protein